jgi:hypothetical protein
LQAKLPQLKVETEALLTLLAELKQGTVGRIMEVSDEELAHQCPKLASVGAGRRLIVLKQVTRWQSSCSRSGTGAGRHHLSHGHTPHP